MCQPPEEMCSHHTVLGIHVYMEIVLAVALTNKHNSRILLSVLVVLFCDSEVLLHV